MNELFEQRTNLSLNPAEAAMALHALRLYVETKGADSSVSTKHLEGKLEEFIASCSVQKL